MGVPRFVWLRDGRDDWVHATIYWRVGVSRFGGSGSIVGVEARPEPNSYLLNADGSVSFDPGELFKIGVVPESEDDDDGEWR